MKQNQRFSQGFSIVELLIVVAIIAILAAIALPQYQKFMAKSRRAEGVLLIEGVHKAELAYFATDSVFADNFGIHLLIDNLIDSKYYSFTGGNTIRFQDQSVRQNYRILVPAYDTNGIDQDPAPDVLCLTYPIDFGECGVPIEPGEVIAVYDDLIYTN